MAISNYIPSSRIAQSGVCTSSTRPASPFEGQMIFETDTNRVLVWDNAAWVMIADTDQPPGLQLIKTQVVGTSQTSVPVTGVFSAEYDHYRITYQGATNATGECIRVQMGSTTSNYYGNLIYANYGSGAGQSVADGPAASFTHCSGGFYGHTALDVMLMNPFQSTNTHLSSSIYVDQNNAGSKRGILSDTVSYTDFTFVVKPSFTITGGTIRVYGFRN